MTLQWFDCKFRSIADSPDEKWTACAAHRDGGGWWWSVVNGGDGGTGTVDAATREAAKAAAEAWLDERDKPEWHDAPTGLASWAVWRGWTLTIWANGTGCFYGHAAFLGTGNPAWSNLNASAIRDGRTPHAWGRLREAQDAFEADVRGRARG